MTSIMNTYYKMKETHVSNISSLEDRKSKPGLKTATLMNNNTMNNDYRTTIMDTPVPHIGVATISPTPFRSIIRSLRDTARKAANTAKRKWNEYYDWLSTYVPPPTRVPPNSPEGSALRNNNITTILDEPLPDIGVETLRPTLFRRRIQSLKDTTRKVINKVNKKLNDFNDLIIDYVPPAIRVNPSSAIEKLKNYITKLYPRSTEFTPIEKKAAKGCFKTVALPGNEYKDLKLYFI